MRSARWASRWSAVHARRSGGGRTLTGSRLQLPFRTRARQAQEGPCSAEGKLSVGCPLPAQPSLLPSASALRLPTGPRWPRARRHSLSLGLGLVHPGLCLPGLLLDRQSPGGCSGRARVSRGLAAVPHMLSLMAGPDLCPGAQVHFLAVWSQGRKCPLRASPVSARVQGRGRPQTSSRGSGCLPPHTHAAARGWLGCPRLCDRAGQTREAAGSVALISRATLSQGAPSPEGKQFNQQRVASAGTGAPGCQAPTASAQPSPCRRPQASSCHLWDLPSFPTLGPLSSGPGCPPQIGRAHV